MQYQAQILCVVECQYLNLFFNFKVCLLFSAAKLLVMRKVTGGELKQTHSKMFTYLVSEEVKERKLAEKPK